MDADTIRWLFIAFAIWCSGLSIAFFGLVVAQVRTNFAVNLFISTLGEKMQKALHNDDNHLKLDALIDKMTSGDKRYEDYFDLKNQCNFILEDKTTPTNERVGAAALAAVCEFILITKFKKTKETV